MVYYSTAISGICTICSHVCRLLEPKSMEFHGKKIGRLFFFVRTQHQGFLVGYYSIACTTMTSVQYREYNSQEISITYVARTFALLACYWVLTINSVVFSIKWLSAWLMATTLNINIIFILAFNIECLILRYYMQVLGTAVFDTGPTLQLLCYFIVPFSIWFGR